MSDSMRDNDLMEGQVVELTEAEQAQHQAQMEQQLKSFWAKQLQEVRYVCVSRLYRKTNGMFLHAHEWD
jgi:hypothetical protein